MQAQPIVDEINLDSKSMDADQALRVVIAYDDLTSGKRAMGVMTDIGKAFGDAIEAIDRIHRRAEMVTPILDEILHQHYPAPRWGINE